MNFFLKNIAIIISILLLLFACKPIEELKEIKGYAICLGEFQTFNEADLFKSKVDFSLWAELRIKSQEKDKHYLLLSEFATSFQAGQKAFELWKNSLIINYKIYKDGKFVHDDFANIFFVAKYQGRPSIYNYNLITKTSKLFWSRWGRKVITLNHNADKSESYFATALGYGKKGSFPYVRDARIYKYSSEKDEVNELSELGDGIQLYTYWDTRDTFKVNITKPDSINSDFVIQEIHSYDSFGKIEIVTKRKFSLTKEGFPKPPLISPQFISNNRSFQIRAIDEGTITYFYLRNNIERSEELIGSTNGKIEKVVWTEDDSFAFLVISDKSSKQSNSNLIVMDIIQKKNTKTFHKISVQNLLVHGNLLFFDDHSKLEQRIVVYDFQNDLIYDEINMPGGCGLNLLL